ncbi:hypothetical protein V6N13_107006 [Hibiscus sabdariffa]|uniref:Uncharacterized protein n=1 Tax=Hibiscus sabdariffa TaxID=183260 RepID=A0ABR2F2J8_9ROSI
MSHLSKGDAMWCLLCRNDFAEGYRVSKPSMESLLKKNVAIFAARGEVHQNQSQPVWRLQKGRTSAWEKQKAKLQELIADENGED